MITHDTAGGEAGIITAIQTDTFFRERVGPRPRVRSHVLLTNHESFQTMGGIGITKTCKNSVFSLQVQDWLSGGLHLIPQPGAEPFFYFCVP
jgi:hypothetical protein